LTGDAANPIILSFYRAGRFSGMKVMNKGLKIFVVAGEHVRRWVSKKSWRSFLIATISLVVLVHFYIALLVPPSTEKVWKEIQVTDGMSFRAIAAVLQKEGVIRYRGYFEIIGRLQGISRKVRTGYYGMSTSMSLWDVLEALRKGRIIEYEVVIPEDIISPRSAGHRAHAAHLRSAAVHQPGKEQELRPLTRCGSRFPRRLFVPGHVLSAQGQQA
jgi:hypothetical protein